MTIAQKRKWTSAGAASLLGAIVSGLLILGWFAKPVFASWEDLRDLKSASSRQRETNRQLRTEVQATRDDVTAMKTDIAWLRRWAERRP